MMGNTDAAGEVKQAARRLGDLIEALDEHPDPSASGPARELVALVLDLHALGLARLMAILGKAEHSEATMAQLLQDDHVRAMLLLHGLHPQDMETRVWAAVERLRPHLGVHGLRVDVVEVAGGAVRLRINGANAGIRAPLLWTLPAEIEDAIVEAAPDAERIVIEGLAFAGQAASQAAE